MLETALFYLISFGVLVSAFGVILSRSAVYSLLWLVAAMCMTAGLFALLKAFLVATILVLVYAGAILVLFLFVVMMVGVEGRVDGWKGMGLSPVYAVTIGTLVFIQAFLAIRAIDRPAAAPVAGTAEAIGRVLFGRYVLPFELTAFLLLAAIVAVVVLAKRDSA